MCRTELSVQAIVDHQQAGKKGTHGVSQIDKFLQNLKVHARLGNIFRSLLGCNVLSLQFSNVFIFCTEN